MSALSSTLRWLKISRKNPCVLVTTPDPRKYFGMTKRGSDIQEFELKFEGTFNSYVYQSHNPVLGFAVNGDLSNLLPNAKPSKHTGSPWVRLIAKDPTTSEGKTIREVLVEIMDKFPQYDLRTEESIDEAIIDMEAKIGTVAESREVEV